MSATPRAAAANPAQINTRSDPDEAIGLREAAATLGVHYMTAYRYVRIGRLPAYLDGDQWRIRLADLDAFAAAPAVRPGRRVQPAPAVSHGVFAPRLQARMVAGDEHGAWQVVESAMRSGATPTDIYLRLLEPSLVEIGNQWQLGELTIADEHIASAVAARLIGRLGPRFVTRGHRRGTVVLGSAPGDRHSLGTAILADVLRGAGYHALDLGADVPSPMFVRATEQAPKLRAVAISAHTSVAARTVRAVVNELRNSGYAGPIIAGGPAIPSLAAARRRGADGWAVDGIDLVELLDVSRTAARPAT